MTHIDIIEIYLRAFSSVVERHIDIVKVGGSIPPRRTKRKEPTGRALFFWCESDERRRGGGVAQFSSKKIWVTTKRKRAHTAVCARGTGHVSRSQTLRELRSRDRAGAPASTSPDAARARDPSREA